MTHTLQQDFEHFLSYSGLASESEDVRAKLLVAYTANWSVLGKGSVIQKLMVQRDAAVAELEDWRFTNKIDELERLVNAKQAEIDRLMLEFCPNEMTPEQIAEWGRHQRVVPGSRANAGPSPGDMPIDRFVASLSLPVFRNDGKEPDWNAYQVAEDDYIDCPECKGSSVPGEIRGVRCSNCNGTSTVKKESE